MNEEFLVHVYKLKCEFQRKADKTATKEIEDGVREMMKLILQNLKEIKPAFEIADIIPTGSYYEGTKIGAPDEFDFMLTLAKLSGPDKISLQPGCSVWYPHIKLQTGVQFPQRYMVNIVINEESSEFKDFLGNPRIVVRDFWTEIKNVLKEKSLEIKMAQGTMRVEPYDGTKLQFFYNHKFDKASHPTKDYPEIKDGLLPVESLNVGVDLMLAIDHPSIETILQLQGFPMEFKDLLRKHGCHVIPKSCHTDHMAHTKCWFVTFSCMERELISNMNEHHKKCYKILKSLISSDVHTSRKCMNLSSYTLKTAFLFHVYGQNACLYSKSLGSCICDVLHYLASNLCHIRMPCFFARDMNTWGNILETPRIIWNVPETLKGSPCRMDLCWIKLMYKFITYLIGIISSETPSSVVDADIVIYRCEYFKATVGNIMKHYSYGANVFQLKDDLGSLDECTDELFCDYIQNLIRYHKIDLSFLS